MTLLTSSAGSAVKTFDTRILKRRYKPIVQALRAVFDSRLKLVVVFGSQARGEAVPESDHDLFLVIEGLPVEPLARQRAIRTVLLPILVDLPGSINFIAKTPTELATNLTPLILEVCLDGICLYGETYFRPYRQKALAALQQAGLYRRNLSGHWMWLFPELPTKNWELCWEGFFNESR